MDMEGALRARLIAAAPVAALLPLWTPPGGTPVKTVFWVDRPQASPLPAIRLQVISDPRPQHLKGFQELRESRVQLDAMALTYTAAKALGEAAIAAVVPENTSNGIIFNRTLVDASDQSGEQTETQFIHRHRFDLLVWWQAA